MNPRVSVPKIFLRGNRWYVRVQVPKEMQSKLRRKEYWVSLKTSDRTEALQRATSATQKKRREISSVYRRLAEIKETIHELTPDQQTALGREAYARHVERRVDVIAQFEASQFTNLQDYTEAFAKSVGEMVALLRQARSDTPHITLNACLGRIAANDLLSEEEKDHASREVKAIFDDISRGKLHDFRIVMQGGRVTHSDSSNISSRASKLDQDGFYFLKFDPKGSLMGDVWNIAPERSKGRSVHYAAFPEALCATPVGSTCPASGVVLDPFVGTGTTLLVAQKMGRHGIGIDLSSEYLRIASERIGLG